MPPDHFGIAGRSPRGGRGLKYSVGIEYADEIASLSSRRAWIEILVKITLSTRTAVALLAEGVD